MKKDFLVAKEYYNNDKDDCNYWTFDRIQKAFNFGKGTLKDFKRYIKEII
jgi:hypothetical protein